MSASTSDDPPPVLGLDTSAAQCAAAIVSGDRVLARLAEEMTKGQAERLAPMIAEALEAAGLGPADLRAVAVCTGPGNFTGVRIGVSAARGLALTLGVPSIGVARAEALAAAAAAEAPMRVAATAGARRGEVHAQAFEAAPGIVPRPLCDLAQGAPEALAGALPRCDLAVGPGAAGIAPRLGARAGGAGDLVDPVWVARLAALRLASGERPPRPAPVYLRPPDAAPPAEPPPELLPDPSP